MSKQDSKKQNNKLRTFLYVTAIVLVVLFSTCGILAFSANAEVSTLKQDIKYIENDIASLVEDTKEKDTDDVKSDSAKLQEHIAKARKELTSPVFEYGPSLMQEGDKIRNDIQNGVVLLDVLEDVNENIVLPFANLLDTDYNGLSKKDLFESKTINAGFDFLHQMQPVLERNIEIINDIHFLYLDTREYEENIKQDLDTIKTLIGILNDSEKSIFQPLARLMKQYPLSDLHKTEKGLNVGILLAYLDFIDSTEPEIENIASRLEMVEFHFIDVDIQKYFNQSLGMFEKLVKLEDYRELIRLFLGNGEDRTYLVMAQNTAEIRASGGFPGSMGLVRIENGILSMGEFSTVRNFLQIQNGEGANITYIETALFQSMYTKWSHDACYNPDFTRVAEITKTAYEARNEEEIDGIIAVTPEIIQKILNLTGKTIKLEDGTKLTGDNATKIIQRDLYYKYQGDESTAVINNGAIDGLFAETAKSAIGLLFRSISMNNITEYLDFLGTCGENRMMLLWFANENEEAVAESMHCAGNLSNDPENPVAGVYFSCCDPGKLGMFTAMAVTGNLKEVREDGSKVYSMRATFNNYIDTENIGDINSWYLLGSNNKAIQGYAYFFAPADGTVSDFKSSNGQYVRTDEYEGLQVGYILNCYLYPGKPLSITYTLTTSRDANNPLEIDTTPTLQNYR